MPETSMSDLSTYMRCDRKYYYGVVRGLRPRSSSRNMVTGTRFHRAIAAGYRAWQNPAFGKSWFKAEAEKQLFADFQNGFTDHEQLYPPVNADDPAVQADIHLLYDMVRLFWQELGQKDEIDEILKIEEPTYLTLGEWTVRGTFDMLSRIGGRLTIDDHKTVESLDKGASFLPLDFQDPLYQLMAWRTYGEEIDFRFNMIRREVPPGFGHREIRLKKDGQPAANNASQNPADYIVRIRSYRSVKQLEAFEAELKNLLGRVSAANADGIWVRRHQKYGALSCNFCPYNEVCGQELSGNEITPENLALLYDGVVK